MNHRKVNERVEQSKKGKVAHSELQLPVNKCRDLEADLGQLEEQFRKLYLK
jgi:hypothetical protein